MPESNDLVIARVLSILSWAQAHQGSTAQQIADHFGYTPEKVGAYLRVMDDLDGRSVVGAMPYVIDWVAWDRDQRLFVTGIAPPKLSDDEALRLLVALRVLTPLMDPDEAARLPGLLADILAMASPDLKSFAPALADIDVRTDDDAAALLDALDDAVNRGVRVAFAYWDRRGAKTLRTVEPLRLEQHQRAWHLIGWDIDRDAERRFRTDQMADLSVSELPVTHALGEGPAGTSTEPTESSEVTVTVGRGARWLADDNPDRVVASTNDTWTLRLTTWHPAWLESVLIDVAPHLISVEPAEWAERMRARATAALDAWKDAE